MLVSQYHAQLPVTSFPCKSKYSVPAIIYMQKISNLNIFLEEKKRGVPTIITSIILLTLL